MSDTQGILYIPPADIEKELGRIWESLKSENKIRACLFNLIFYTKKDRRDAYLHTIAQKVIEQFPSRVIFISVDNDNKQDYLKSSVSVLFAGKGTNAAACDLIQIDVAGPKQERVPFVILPHLIPDLPVYLVWEEDPAIENATFIDLGNLASRIIFDSESCNSLPEFAQMLLKHHSHLKLDIADLNWGRGENWRDLISSTFQAKENLAHLEQTSTITLSYNAIESESFCHTRIQAIYLQTWIACQMQWLLKKMSQNKDSIQFLYEKDKREISVTLTPQKNPKLVPGLIMGLELTTVNQDHYSLVRNPDVPNHILINHSTAKTCDLPITYIFSKGESGKSLVKEICHKGTSAHYLKVLEVLQKMEPIC